MKKLSLLIYALIIILFWNCTNVEDWSDPKDDVPPGEVTNVQVENINGGAILRYTRPNDSDLMGIKAVYSFSEIEELMEVYASAFSDSIVVEGYADTNEHKVEVYAVDKSGNMSQPSLVTIKPLPPPVDLVRQSLQVIPTFSGVRALWDNPFQKPMSISLYVADPESGERVLYDRHYSSAKDGGYTFRSFPSEEHAFTFEITDRWNHTAAPLDTLLTPVFEQQILGQEGVIQKWNYYDYANNLYRGDPIPANIVGGVNRFRNLFDGNTWDNSAYYYIRSATMDQYIPEASASSYILPAYLTIDMGVPARYSRLKYWTRGRSPVYSSWVWYKFEVWGTNNPKPVSEVGDGSQEANLEYWTSWREANGTDAWKQDWEMLADCEIIFPSGTPSTVPSVTSAEDIEFVMDGFGFDINDEMTTKPFRYIRFVLKENNTDNVPYIQWSELQFWGIYE